MLGLMVGTSQGVLATLAPLLTEAILVFLAWRWTT